MIGTDGFSGRGPFDVDGESLQPPPRYPNSEYENTTKLVASLEADVLSLTHYEVLRGGDIDDLVAETPDFVTEIETLPGR